jgi:hypothetical protein
MNRYTPASFRGRRLHKRLGFQNTGIRAHKVNDVDTRLVAYHRD